LTLLAPLPLLLASTSLLLASLFAFDFVCPFLAGGVIVIVFVRVVVSLLQWLLICFMDTIVWYNFVFRKCPHVANDS